MNAVRVVALAALATIAVASCRGDNAQSVSAGSQQDSPAAQSTDAGGDPADSASDESEMALVAGSSGECSEAGERSQEELRGLAELMARSPFDAILNVVDFESAADAFRSSSDLLVGPIESARTVELEPLNVLPAKDGGSNEHAGNAAFWSGLELTVRNGDGSVQVLVPLAAGGEDVVGAATPSTEGAIDALVGLCSLVTSGDPHGVPILGGPRLVAIATSRTGQPVSVSPQFATVISQHDSLDSIVAAADLD